MGWGLKDGWEELLSLDNVAAVNDVSGECIEEKGVDPVIVVPTSSFLLISWLLLPCEFEDEEVDGRKSLVVGGSKILKNVKSIVILGFKCFENTSIRYNTSQCLLAIILHYL